MSDTESPEASPRARRGRKIGRSGAGAGINQRPFKQPKRRFAPTAIVSEDELEAIHLASLRVLEEIGLDVLYPEAKDLLSQAGAALSPGSDRVRIPWALVEQALASVPHRLTLHARNPAHSLQIGGDWTAFCAVASAPNAFDRVRGRRAGNQADYQDFLRLGQSLTSVHLWGGYPVEPIDLHASVRHLHALRDMMVLTDKVPNAYALGHDRITDAMEIVRLAHGLSEADFAKTPCMATIINSNSPLKLDIPMLNGLIEMARKGQLVVLTPFTLAGAMAPVTIAGAVTQQNAEALAGLVIHQLANPGAPFGYGGFTSNVDMKSGAPAFGTPEYMKAAMLGGQLARKYGLPYRSSNVCAANCLDAQAAYESVFSLWGAIQGGVNMLMHGAGWMEGGLHAGFEKMVLDADLLHMVSAFLEPLALSEDDLALEAMAEVGPGGHFFGTAHTQARYKTAFYEPLISDWRNFESWSEAGSPTAYDRAHGLYQQILASYEQPAMDPARLEAVDAFVAKRVEQGGAATDF